MFSEIKNLLGSIVKWCIICVALALYLFFFNVKNVFVHGHRLIVPWISKKSFIVDLFSMMKEDLIPPGVNLIVSSPFTAVLIEMKIAFFLAFIFALPFLLINII